MKRITPAAVIPFKATVAGVVYEGELSHMLETGSHYEHWQWECPEITGHVLIIRHNVDGINKALRSGSFVQATEGAHVPPEIEAFANLMR